MKNVVGYCRVSTEAQCGEDRYGLDEQKRIIMEYCSTHDMQISDWYIDEGVSGAKESRPALDELLYGEVKNPPVEAVIVPKSDRMARDIKLYFYYMMVLERKNMQLISATEAVVNDDTGLGNVYKALILFVAEQERKNITKRTSGGRRIKAARGGYSGGKPPFGYKPVDGKLVIVPEEAEIIRKIFKERREGETYMSIIDSLHACGYRTRTNTKFSIGSIQSILGNEKLYQGMYKYGPDSEWVQGMQEPILKEDE